MTDKSTMNIVIDEKYCKGCALCLHFCKKKVFELSKKTNNKGYSLPCVVTPEKCSACKTCERICPEFAITVEEG